MTFDRTTTKAATEAAYKADDALSAELVRVYGKGAAEARYWPTAWHSDLGVLAALSDKLEADKRMHEAFDAAREVRS